MDIPWSKSLLLLALPFLSLVFGVRAGSAGITFLFGFSHRKATYLLRARAGIALYRIREWIMHTLCLLELPPRLSSSLTPFFRPPSMHCCCCHYSLLYPLLSLYLFTHCTVIMEQAYMGEGTSVDKVRYFVAFTHIFVKQQHSLVPAYYLCMPSLRQCAILTFYLLYRAKMHASRPLSVPLPLPTWSRRRWDQRAWTRFCNRWDRTLWEIFPLPMMEPPFCDPFIWTMPQPRYWWILPRCKMMKWEMELPVWRYYVESYCE